MSNEKKTKKNEEVITALAVETAGPWVEKVLLRPALELDPALTDAPLGSVRRLLALGVALEEQKPSVMSAGEATSLAGVVDGREVAEAFLTYVRKEVSPDVGGAWTEVVSLVATATGMAALAARSKLPSLATEAAAVSSAVFGEDVSVSRMTPQETAVEVDRVKEAVTTDAALYARLTAFVPAALMAALFEANDRLKVALGMKGRAAPPLPVDRRMVAALLRQRMRRYIRWVAASVDEDDPGTVARARAALQPIAAFREQSARLRAKGVTVAEEVEEVEEVEDAGTTPADADEQ